MKALSSTLLAAVPVSVSVTSGPSLTPLEEKLLRNVADDDRLRGIVESEQEVRFALRRLVDLKLVRYNAERPRQKFNVTSEGRRLLGP